MGDQSIINELMRMRLQAAQGSGASKPSPPSSEEKPGKSFDELLKETVAEVNQLQMEAGDAMEKLAVGEGGIHETMIAMEKAGVSFKMLMQVRNKVLAAYQEIMRMQM